MKCRDCRYYKAIDGKSGTCYGIEIKGDRDPAKGSDKCRGRFFKPRVSTRK